MATKDDIPRELKPWFKVFDQLCNRHDYVTVFDDFLLMTLNWFANAEFKDQWLDRKRRYNEKELPLFNMLYNELTHLMEDQIVKKEKAWYDPFGDLYQVLSSRGKASKLGQFFTPETLCTFIAHSVVNKDRIEELVGDPACGSGRMLLAAHAVNRTNHYVAQDLDRMCCMMTAINMALHCMSGVVIHGNTLSMETYAYWAVSRVEVEENVFLPKINIITKEQYEEWHERRLFISKWINPQRKTEFDAEEQAEIIESFENSSNDLEVESTQSIIRNDSLCQTTQSIVFEETNRKNDLPLKVQKQKPKLIINPDSQLSLFD